MNEHGDSYSDISGVFEYYSETRETGTGHDFPGNREIDSRRIRRRYARCRHATGLHGAGSGAVRIRPLLPSQQAERIAAPH
jgi:hypothetical protein